MLTLQQIIVFFLLLISVLESKRIGGFGGFRGKRGKSTGSTSRGYTRPKTLLYSRNYGGYTGRHTSSSNGFGLALGIGLYLGFRSGFMGRPFGYNDPNHSYKRQHEGKNYNRREDGLVECAVADVTNYIKLMSEDQEVDTEEATKLCDAGQDICYGKITVAAVNLTMDSGAQESILEVRITKGCGVKASFLQGQDPNVVGKYNSVRECWTTKIKDEKANLVTATGAEITLDNNTEDSTTTADSPETTMTVFELPSSSMVTEFKLTGSVSSNGDIQWQSETCMCYGGDLCNGATKYGGNVIHFATLALLTKLYFNLSL